MGGGLMVSFIRTNVYQSEQYKDISLGWWRMEDQTEKNSNKS
jgi:hypothetical protein